MFQRPHYFSDDQEGWEDIPAWDAIVADWTARMQRAGADTSINELPLVASRLESHSYLDSREGTWLPAETLSRMKAAHASQISLLTRGEQFSFADPTTEFPYVPAGASDIAKILVGHQDPATFAAAMIASSSLVAPSTYDQPESAIHRIAYLAFAHLESLPISVSDLIGRNRKKWLPVHQFNGHPQTYDEAISALVDEHTMVLNKFRPVHLVPYVKGPDGVQPADHEDIKSATEIRRNLLASMSHPVSLGIEPFGAEHKEIDWDARQLNFKTTADEERYNLALDFFNTTISANGQNPARYARRPRRIDISTKPAGRRAITITLSRDSEPWEDIRDCDQAFEDSRVSFLFNRDGDNCDAAAAIREFIEKYEAALNESAHAHERGLNPADVHPDEVRISHLVRRALDLANIELGKDLLIYREGHMGWAIGARLDFDHPRSIYSDFSVQDGVLCFREICLPCSTHGGITLQGREPDKIYLIVFRPLDLPDGGILSKHFQCSALEGLPDLIIKSAHVDYGRTFIRLDPSSPGLAPAS